VCLEDNKFSSIFRDQGILNISTFFRYFVYDNEFNADLGGSRFSFEFLGDAGFFRNSKFWFRISNFGSEFPILVQNFQILDQNFQFWFRISNFGSEFPNFGSEFPNFGSEFPILVQNFQILDQNFKFWIRISNFGSEFPILVQNFQFWFRISQFLFRIFRYPIFPHFPVSGKFP
jgi:hypothetical protein